MWLTVPVQSRGKFEQTIRETRIDPSPNWKSKHLSALRHNYSRAPFFDHYFQELSEVYNRGHEFLAELRDDPDLRRASSTTSSAFQPCWSWAAVAITSMSPTPW